jgi:hypothetical protein
MAAAALSIPALMRAQDRSLRGVVTSDSAPVPYAIVELRPGRRIFTDERGAFTLLHVAPGRIRLEVRQIGFAPLDTILDGDSASSVRLALRRLAMRLPAITVAAGACQGSGESVPPDGGDLSVILSQLLEHARRFQLMADEYPFVYRMQRASSEINRRESTTWQGIDTITIRSDQRLRYEPGRIFRPGLGPRGRPARVVQVPQLPDLADSAFRARHCFRYAGETSLDGVPALLVAFDARRPLLSFDVDGEAWMDARTWQLLRVGIRVVPAEALPDMLSLEVLADFREILPFVLVPKRILTVTALSGRAGQPFGRQEEEQRLLNVHFLRPLGAVP